MMGNRFCACISRADAMRTMVSSCGLDFPFSMTERLGTSMLMREARSAWVMRSALRRVAMALPNALRNAASLLTRSFMQPSWVTKVILAL